MTCEENYCGNCGMDLNGVTVGQMREMAARDRLCPECQRLLDSAAGMADEMMISEVE